MQLVAMGAQDVFLTGNPQITFFKVVYRRHTNFSKECIKQEFNGSVPTAANTSGTVTCTLARNGDLVQEVYLKATLNAVDEAASAVSTLHQDGKTITATTHGFSDDDSIQFTNDISDDNEVVIFKDNRYVVTGKTANTFEIKLNGADVRWTANTNITITDVKVKTDSAAIDKDISNLIQTVEVEIGGQKIDKHYSAWLDIYNELFETNHDYRNRMSEGTPGNNKTVYIPLRFWFNRNAGLALPLIALQYHEVKLSLALRVPVDSTMSDAGLLVNYVYLDTDERRRFAQVSHEYLIEQVQHTGVETVPLGARGVSARVDMNFNHPVKALFWKTTSGNNFLDKVKLQLNGHDRFSEQDADYFHLVQPYESNLGNGHSMTAGRVWGALKECNKDNSVGMYSFCLKPGEHQPSGSCNFSRIDNARLNYKLGEVVPSTSQDELHLFALNYNVLRIMSGMGGLTYSN